MTTVSEATIARAQAVLNIMMQFEGGTVIHVETRGRPLFRVSWDESGFCVRFEDEA